MPWAISTKPRSATAARRASRSVKCQYGAASDTWARRATSRRLKPCGPFLAISAAAASTSVSRRLPAGWVDLRRGDIGLGSSPLGGATGTPAT